MRKIPNKLPPIIRKTENDSERRKRRQAYKLDLTGHPYTRKLVKLGLLVIFVPIPFVIGNYHKVITGEFDGMYVVWGIGISILLITSLLEYIWLVKKNWFVRYNKYLLNTATNVGGSDG